MSLRNTEVIRAMAMTDGVRRLRREMIPQLSDDDFMIVATGVSAYAVATTKQ